MFRGEIEKDGMKGFRHLRMGEHGFHFVECAETQFEVGVLFGGREMATGLAAPVFGEIGVENSDGFKVIHCQLAESSAGFGKGIDDGGGWFGGRDPFVNM